MSTHVKSFINDLIKYVSDMLPFDLQRVSKFASDNHLMVVIVAIFFIWKSLMKGKGGGKVVEYPGNLVQHVSSDEEWKAVQESAKGKIVLVDFFANWCGPCRIAAPIFGKMSTEYTDVVFAKVDVDKMRGLMGEYGVRAMPTFVLLQDGKVLESVEGFREAQLRGVLDKRRRGKKSE